MTRAFLSVQRRDDVVILATREDRVERYRARPDQQQAESEILAELRTAVRGAQAVVVDVRDMGMVRPQILSLVMRLARELRSLGLRAAFCGGETLHEIWYVCRAGKLADMYVDLPTALGAVRRSRGPADESSGDPSDSQPSGPSVSVVEGDLLDQPVDVIVNAWNRNILPWWLLWPQGVSGAIKRRAGLEPFRELARLGPIPLGGAVVTSAGKLPFRAIIHVAGINLLWRSSERSVRDSVRNALATAESRGDRSIALPLIGAGSGGGNADRVLEFMLDEIGHVSFRGQVVVVRYKK